MGPRTDIRPYCPVSILSVAMELEILPKQSQSLISWWTRKLFYYVGGTWCQRPTTARTAIIAPPSSPWADGTIHFPLSTVCSHTVGQELILIKTLCNTHTHTYFLVCVAVLWEEGGVINTALFLPSDQSRERNAHLELLSIRLSSVPHSVLFLNVLQTLKHNLQ